MKDQNHWIKFKITHSNNYQALLKEMKLSDSLVYKIIAIILILLNNGNNKI